MFNQVACIFLKVYINILKYIFTIFYLPIYLSHEGHLFFLVNTKAMFGVKRLQVPEKGERPGRRLKVQPAHFYVVLF